MQKAKIMLMAIAVLAVVGGALAFKAKKFGVFMLYSCTQQRASAISTCVAEDGYFTFGVNPYPTLATISINGAMPEGTPCDEGRCTYNISIRLEDW